MAFPTSTLFIFWGKAFQDGGPSFRDWRPGDFKWAPTHLQRVASSRSTCEGRNRCRPAGLAAGGATTSKTQQSWSKSIWPLAPPLSVTRALHLLPVIHPQASLSSRWKSFGEKLRGKSGSQQMQREKMGSKQFFFSHAGRKERKRWA